MLKRAAGVLLNISSLPSQFGIGGFGKEIELMCEFLKRGGFTYWQILPITTIGMGNSPYSSESAFAINSLYIDPYKLLEDGLVTKHDVDNAKYKGEPWQVDYDNVKKLKGNLLKIAFNNAKDINLDKFIKKSPWVKAYAEFKTLKELNNEKAWYEWDIKLKDREEDCISRIIKNNKNTYMYYVFEQYICQKQWNEARVLCKKYGIKIIGDMPMYVSLDSSDVWGDRKQFLLNKKGSPKKVAGVPPDYFSEDGQLWGNPLYDYNYMREDGFKWWMSRVDQMMNVYDILRIDHFRAFSQYWAVDANAKTAKEGKWCKGAGMDLFNLIYTKYSKDRFIAEDLGIIDNKVRKLLKETGLPCMRVFQFGFDSDESIHLPKNYTENTVGYTATHDNNTTLGWLYELDDNTRRKVLHLIDCDYSVWGIGSYENVSVKKCIKNVLDSKCFLAIIPFQDLCGFGSDCRMNTPGVAEDNWKYRIIKEQMDLCPMDEYYKMLKETNRL